MGKKQRSILAHIRQVLVAGLIILVTVIELASVVAIQKALLKDTKTEISMEANSKAVYVDSWLSKKVEETELIAKSVSVMGDFTDEEMQDYLTQFAGTDSDVLNFYLCREGITYVIYNGGIFDLDPTGRSWWTAAWNAQATIITDAYVDANTGAIVVSVATPFYMNDVRSVVLADITIDKMVSTITEKNNENISIFLLGSDGGVIVHENPDLCMKDDGTSTNIPSLYGIDINADGDQNYVDESGNKQLVTMSAVENSGWYVGAYISKAYMASRIIKALIFVLAVAILTCAFGIFYFASMVKKQLAPMSDMKSFIKDVIVRSENIRGYRHEKDEIAFLITEMKDNFVETIRKTRTEMDGIESDIQETNGSVGEIVDAVSNISAVIQETAAAMDTQTANITNISDDCNVISNASVAVAGQAQEMATRSSEIVARIDELTPKMRMQRDNSMNSCKESQNKVNEAIKEAECINEITDISDAIKNIASQTNLLSLNASIESARAGEAGRGFAVVAEEIRSLSDETSNEINKISDLADRLLKAVNSLSKESTESMKNLSRDIEQAYDTVEMLSNEYIESARYYSSVSAELGANSEELSASVQTVATSVEDISASQNDVNLAMENASQGIQTVALDATSMREKMENVSVAVEEVSQTVQQFNV